MRIIYSLLILSAYSHQAFAKLDSCEDAMTIDGKYIQVRDSELPEREKRIQYTHLMNAALTPYLKGLHDQITKLTPEQIDSIAALFKDAEIKKHVFDLKFLSSAKPKADVLKGRFEGYIVYDVAGPLQINLPFTNFSYEVMRKLSLALTVVTFLSREKYTSFADPALKASCVLRGERSFQGSNVSAVMKEATVSVGHSAAALIARSFNGRNAEQMLRAVMYQTGKFPSPVVLHALTLPPAFLGQNGFYIYFENPLQGKDGQLTLSSEFKSYLKKEKEELAAQTEMHEPNETFAGCPVAHTSEGFERSGLQYYNDAIMHVYEVLK